VSATFSTKFACNLIEYVRNQGHDVNSLYEHLGLSSQYLNREDIRIPSGKMSTIWERAMELVNDDDVGLHMGAAFGATALRTTSMIMQSSPTLYEALERGVKYSALIADVLTTEIGESDDHIYLEFTPKQEWLLEPARVVKDCLNITLVSAFNSVRQLTGQPISPAFLSVTYRRAANIQEYVQIFDCDIAFEEPFNRIGFPKQLGTNQITTKDGRLLVTLEEYARELKASFIENNNYMARTQQLILDMMAPRPPTLDQVANALHLSPRSLQRKLKKETSATYKDLVDQVRRKLCDRLMEDSDRTVDEVGQLIGYSDTASFIRAFKRWHGKTPRQMIVGEGLELR